MYEGTYLIDHLHYRIFFHSHYCSLGKASDDPRSWV